MKRKIIPLAAIFMTFLVFAAPAAAGPPRQFTDVVSLQEPDPCNPDVIQTTTLTADIKVHEHQNVFVTIVDFTVETDTGYFGWGRQTVVDGDEPTNHLALTLTAIASNAEGDRYKVNQHVTVTPNGVANDRSDIRCLVDG